jgi:hypothetical protein
MKTVVLAIALAFPIVLPGNTVTCESLATLALPNTTITIAETRPAGEFTPPGGMPIFRPCVVSWAQ